MTLMLIEDNRLSLFKMLWTLLVMEATAWQKPEIYISYNLQRSLLLSVNASTSIIPSPPHTEDIVKLFIFLSFQFIYIYIYIPDARVK